MLRLVDRHRAVQVKRFPRGGDPDAAAPAQCAAKKIAKAAGFQQFRPSGFCRPLSDCAAHCECPGDRGAGDCYPLASRWVSLVLAMEVGISRWQTDGGARNSPADPRHERGQPAVGRSADPWRTPQTWHRCSANLGRQIHGKAFLRNHADGIASIDLFVVPTLSLRLLYGLLILSHGRRQILWLGVTAHPSAEWIARQLTEAEVHHPQSRSRLRRDIQTAASRDGHSRPANCAPLAMAEWPYGTAD